MKKKKTWNVKNAVFVSPVLNWIWQWQCDLHAMAGQNAKYCSNFP
jgi:hypothetical protein